MKDLHKRFLSAIIGIVLLILIVLKSGYILSISAFLVSIIGIRELYKAFENMGYKANYFIGYLAAFILLLVALNGNNHLGLVLMSLTFITLFNMILNNKFRILDALITIFGFIYVPFMLFHILLIKDAKIIFLIFIISFGTDTFAYFAGNLFGKKKLCPSISPNKTVEGSIGGILGSLILVVVYAYIVHIPVSLKLLILSIVSSIISQTGDLIASRIKRITGIKDFGFIMPGHGGVLDRFDSIIFTAPVIYYFMLLILN